MASTYKVPTPHQKQQYQAAAEAVLLPVVGAVDKNSSKKENRSDRDSDNNNKDNRSTKERERDNNSNCNSNNMNNTSNNRNRDGNKDKEKDGKESNDDASNNGRDERVKKREHIPDRRDNSEDGTSTLPPIEIDALPYNMNDDDRREYEEQESAHRLALSSISQKFAKIRRCVGSGLQGCVYECIEYDTGRKIAVKVVSKEYYMPEEILLKFANHPHILRLAWYTYCKGFYINAYDFIDGAKDVSSVLCSNDSGIMPHATVARIAYDIANALAYLHDRGVAHMDVKVENILVVPQRGFEKAWNRRRGLRNDASSSESSVTRQQQRVDWVRGVGFHAILIDFGSCVVRPTGRKRRDFSFAPCIHNRAGINSETKGQATDKDGQVLTETKVDKYINMIWKHQHLEDRHRCHEDCPVYRKFAAKGIVCSSSSTLCKDRAITMGYVPPELFPCRNYPQCNGPAADAYALGAAMFRMAFGMFPVSDDRIERMQDLVKSDPDRAKNDEVLIEQLFAPAFPASAAHCPPQMIALIGGLLQPLVRKRLGVRDVLSSAWTLDLVFAPWTGRERIDIDVSSRVAPPSPFTRPSDSFSERPMGQTQVAQSPYMGSSAVHTNVNQGPPSYPSSPSVHVYAREKHRFYRSELMQQPQPQPQQPLYMGNAYYHQQHFQPTLQTQPQLQQLYQQPQNYPLYHHHHHYHQQQQQQQYHHQPPPTPLQRYYNYHDRHY